MFVWTSGDHEDGRIQLWSDIEWGRLEARVNRIYRFRIVRRRVWNELRECFTLANLVYGIRFAAWLTGWLIVGGCYLLLAWLALALAGD